MSEKRSLLVLVDGVPTVVAYSGDPILLQIVTDALAQLQLGKPAQDWKLHTPYELLPRDLSLRLDQLDLPADAQLFLTPPEAGLRAASAASINKAEPGRLWDESGREWTTKHAQWASEKQVAAFLHRHAPVGFIDDRGWISWLDSDMAKRFWAKAEGYFEVPGVSGSRLTQPGVRWGAHIWKRDTQRRLVFVEFT
ncbi:MAG TPA: hypothetical protein VGB75_10690 [Jatrophihabitans sp.]|jgi:hypothetical protein|uniref:hypothetical protein n=1 Tax=Jatrophihabitans sp. TaxID=1932789 RepID=UPI002EFEE743